MNDRLLCMQVESLGVNGVGLARGAQAIGFRGIPLLPDHGRFDGKLPICTLIELGPHDPADRYHHLAFAVPVARVAARRFLRRELYAGNGLVAPDFAPGEAVTLHLEWTFDGRRTLAKFSADAAVELLLIVNGCLEPAAVASAAGAVACLEQRGWRMGCACTGDVRAAMAPGRTIELLQSRLAGLTGADPDGNGPAPLAGLRVRVSPEASAYVALAEHAAEAPDASSVDEALRAGRAEMASRLMDSGGAAAGCAEAIQRAVGFAAAYDPESQLRFVPVNRDWSGPNALPPVFLWDNVFDAYLACFFNPDLARESLAHILGIVRDRGLAGAPMQRNLIVPVVAAKTLRFIGDRDFAAGLFPTLMRLMRFWFEDRGDGHPWRDGNDDGLIECGSLRRPENGHAPAGIVQDAFDETGYDDSPMYSAGFAYERRGLPAEGVEYDFHRGTLNLTMVGQNCLYVAACRALAVLARWVGERADEAWLLGEAERVAARIRERLFDPAVGYFRNRFFDGRFSPVKTPDTFTPLLAGVADAAAQACLRAMLLDPGQFWGENVVPTVSRDDPAYRDDDRHGEYWRGNYWRGNVWAPTNYIVYLAVRQAGWHDVAAALSAKSRRLFMDDWLPRHHVNENYPPEGGTERTQLFTGNGGRDPHYIWGALLPLMALEELFSVEDVTDGIRFGTLQPESFGEWSGFLYAGRRGRVEVGPAGLTLDIDGLLTVRADQPVAIRRFVLDDSGVRFEYAAHAAVRLRIETVGRSHDLALPAGRGTHSDAEATTSTQGESR